jgi:hypothetical protein
MELFMELSGFCEREWPSIGQSLRRRFIAVFAASVMLVVAMRRGGPALVP